eukprot:TRINITY_DN10758_c0_g1_i1.p1 TRINITY_DN10758_c0_g1~~TRINITY_DN10758_c0_g1_i1.p1  ORF type:complete len:173 (-),score=22.20 TRINITY_DN10758_c0_g1_i1:16-534(-)
MTTFSPWKLTTLCYFLNPQKDEILLGRKKRGFGVDKYNGPGGKVEKGESIEDATKRECQEECGLLPTSLQYQGVIDFIFLEKEVWNNRCYIFKCTEWTGDLVETEELECKWYKTSDIPYSKMWPDDSIWIPKMLSGEPTFYRFSFTSDGALVDTIQLSSKDFSSPGDYTPVV